MELSRDDICRAIALLSSSCDTLCNLESGSYDCDTCPIEAMRNLLYKNMTVEDMLAGRRGVE